MDLVGSEARKTGTRGGRGAFTWDAVSSQERHYYLGNSVRVPATSRGGDAQWYARARASSAARPSRSPTDEAEADVEAEADAVRRREQAIVGQVLVGRSFSDAVREALAETVEADAERGEESGAAARRAARRTRDRAEKAQRKEMRRRARELRQARRLDRQRRRERSQGAGSVADAVRRDSTESERESARCRWEDEVSRRRRRRGRPAASRRKRNEWLDTSDSQDSDARRYARRQRLR